VLDTVDANVITHRLGLKELSGSKWARHEREQNNKRQTVREVMVKCYGITIRGNYFWLRVIKGDGFNRK
jgi:hypothetical protein